MEGSKGFHVFLAGAVVVVLLLGGISLSLRSGIGAARADTSYAVMTVQRGTLGQSEVTAVVTGTGFVNLGGFEFDLGVDPSVAHMSGAGVGGFLGTSGRTVGSLGPIISSQGDDIGFGAYSYDPSGNNGPGAAGSGELATITMTVVGEGVSPITLTNTILGDVNANQQQVTTVNSALQVKPLHTGWNLMAFCVDTAGLSVPQAMVSVDGAYSRILGEEGSYVVGIPDMFQTLHGMQPPEGYWVRIDSSSTVTVTQIAPEYPYTTLVPLSAGWHWIGYCNPQAHTVPEALVSIEGKYDRVLGESGSYVVGIPDIFQTLTEMSQCNGYLIHMTSDGTLQYPQRMGQSVSKRQLPAEVMLPKECASLHRTPWMTLVYGDVEVNGSPAPEGTVVQAVTPRGEVAGCAVVKEAGKFGLMQVYGGSEDEPGFAKGEMIRWRVDGAEAKASVSLNWADDKDVHKLTLSVPIGGSGTPSVFLPMVGK